MSFIFNENTGQVDRWIMRIVKWCSQQLYMSLLPPTGQRHKGNKNTKTEMNTSIYIYIKKEKNQMFISLLLYTEMIFLQWKQ